MESSDAFSQYESGDEGPSARPRRMSMEEDMFYRDLMTSRPANPPSYESAVKAIATAQRRASAAANCSARKEAQDVLPQYSCGVHMEGVFMRKMEIEDTTKRAEIRDWRMVYVELRGTALNIYRVKKERAWWPSRHDGPDISPDNPPWVKKATLERSYSLLHADAGIAADYRKYVPSMQVAMRPQRRGQRIVENHIELTEYRRRYVIRIRAETDQFLLSCVQLDTFIKWLEGIFTAIDIAAPLDERDFPRDMSIPRLQRIRWLRGQRPRPEDNSTGFPRLSALRQNNASTSTLGEDDGDEEVSGTGPPLGAGGFRTEHPIVGRLSTSSYPNENIDPDTGKWCPQHKWTVTHDLLYAKLCYAVLLFKSPRKSNYVVARGTRWYVDWDSGRMVRVLPPAYDETSLFGPWQIIRTENRLL